MIALGIVARMYASHTASEQCHRSPCSNTRTIRASTPEEQFEREREKSPARRARLLASLLMVASGLVMDALGELQGRGRFTFLAAGLAADRRQFRVRPVRSEN